MSGGLLLLDKPLGLSSNAALQRVRRRFGGIKAGHTGSLDPLASGMLPICLGEATKIAGELLAGRKCYLFEILLGERRDTGDAEGSITSEMPVPQLSRQQIEAVLARRLGGSQQIPPMYSALKRDGQPLYRLARQGLQVEREPRSIRIDSLELVDWTLPRLRLRTLCSKGTYVRVLAEDLAVDLGTCGHVSLLRREYVEPFEGQPMWTLPQLEQSAELPRLLGADLAIPHLPAITLSAEQQQAIRHGRKVPLQDAPAAAEAVRLYGPGREFFGLGQLGDDGILAARRLFAPPT